MADDDLTFSPSSPIVRTPTTTPNAPSPPIDIDREIMEELRAGRAATSRAEQSFGRQEEILEEKTKALEPIRQRQLETVRQPLPQHPAFRETPPTPQRGDPNADNSWLSAAMMLGALAGGFSRRHVTNGLAAMTGAIQGYQEGSTQKFDQQMKLWDAENKRVVEYNTKALQEYRDILEDRKLNIDQMSIELQIAAQKYDDQATITAAKSKNFLTVAQLHDQNARWLEQFKKSSESLAMQHTAWRDQQWAKEAREYYDKNPQIVEGILSYRLAPPPTNPRTGQLGTYDRELWSRIVAIDPSFDQARFSREAQVKKTEAQIPARAEQAGATAAARTAGVAGTNIELVMRSAAPTIEMAAQAAQGVPATGFHRLNQLLQTVSSEIGDPALRRFQIANLELADMLARALNPRSSIVTVSSLNRAIEIISTADSPEAYQAVLRQIRQFVEREFAAVKQQQRGEPLAPIELPDTTQRQLQPTPRQFLPKATGGTVGGILGRPGPSLTGQGSQLSPDMPIMLPEGWTVKELQ